MQLLANNFASRIKKYYINKIENEAIRAPTADITRKKKVPVKCVRKKSSKILISISGHFKYLAFDVQAFPMKINTVIPALYLFQISLKFQKETCYVMTTS